MARVAEGDCGPYGVPPKSEVGIGHAATDTCTDAGTTDDGTREEGTRDVVVGEVAAVVTTVVRALWATGVPRPQPDDAVANSTDPSPTIAHCFTGMHFFPTATQPGMGGHLNRWVIRLVVAVKG